MANKGKGVESQYANETNKIKFIYIPKNDLKAEFAAFVTGFKDSYKSNWESQEVYGRMDPIGVFKGTKRSISIQFDVPSYSIEDAKFNIEQIQNLIQMTYPVYETRGLGANTLIAAPLIKMQFGNLIGQAGTLTELVGYLESGIDYSPDMEQGVFYTDQMHMIPKLYKVDINFTVLHTHSLGFELEKIQKTTSTTKVYYELGKQGYENPSELVNFEELAKLERAGNIIDPVGQGPFDFDNPSPINAVVSDNLKNLSLNNQIKILQTETTSKTKNTNTDNIRHRFPKSFPFSISGSKK